MILKVDGLYHLHSSNKEANPCQSCQIQSLFLCSHNWSMYHGSFSYCWSSIFPSLSHLSGIVLGPWVEDWPWVVSDSDLSFPNASLRADDATIYTPLVLSTHSTWAQRYVLSRSQSNPSSCGWRSHIIKYRPVSSVITVKFLLFFVVLIWLLCVLNYFVNVLPVPYHSSWLFPCPSRSYRIPTWLAAGFWTSSDIFYGSVSRFGDL